MAAARPAPLVSGTVTVRRAHLLRFPAYELRAEPGLEVGLARFSALNTYFFGPGQKVALPWEVAWRLTSIPRGSALAAVVANEEGRRLAMASPGAVAGHYGINGRDYAFALNPAEARLGRARAWDLSAGEEVVGRFTRRPFGGVCAVPLPLPAVLLALLLTRFGIPGENGLRVPQLNWGPQK
ncbi:MAG: hypothetical protein H6R33_814 [Actinobacteria bacterium]|nr:hypothetical protein [Actinomycetota bacterium]